MINLRSCFLGKVFERWPILCVWRWPNGLSYRVVNDLLHWNVIMESVIDWILDCGVHFNRRRGLSDGSALNVAFKLPPEDLILESELIGLLLIELWVSTDILLAYWEGHLYDWTKTKEIIIRISNYWFYWLKYSHIQKKLLVKVKNTNISISIQPSATGFKEGFIKAYTT